MATATGLLTAIAPQFDAVDSRETILEMAESLTSSTFFGENRALAVALRAAHLLSVTQGASATDGGTTGPISSKREGDLSVSFGNAGNTGTALSSTSYGRELLELSKMSGSTVRTTGVPFVLAGWPRGG